jgi:hypothetical protein
VLTLLGPVRANRWTAACRCCGLWIGSLEQLLDVRQGMSPGAQSAAALTAVMTAYEPAQKVLRELAGLEVDDNRIHRTVAATGPVAREWIDRPLQELFRETGLPAPGTWIYAMIDGGRIRMRDAQWREPCVGALCWQDRQGTWRKLAVSDPRDKGRVTGKLDEWLQWLRQRGRIKMVILADGADWIWAWAAKHGATVQLLDYYHVKEHVWAAANMCCGEGTARARQWAERVIDGIWMGRFRKTLAWLRRRRPSTLAAIREVESLANYIEAHQDYMRYADAREAGCCIGSGVIESMCKQLFSMRLKGPGMFWSEPGARHLMDLRSLYIAGLWDALWRRTPAESRHAAA